MNKREREGETDYGRSRKEPVGNWRDMPIFPEPHVS